MIEPLSPLSSAHVTPASADVPHMAKNLQNLVDQLSQRLHEVVQNPSQADQKSFQRDFKELVLNLNDSVKRAIES